MTNGEVGKVACGKFLKGCKLKRDKSGECKVNGVKGFSIGRAAGGVEWQGNIEGAHLPHSPRRPAEEDCFGSPEVDRCDQGGPTRSIMSHEMRF
jgi:hypothetical protein